MIVVKWFFRILPILYMIAVWIMSSLPADAVVELPAYDLDRFIKEALHLVEFAILFWLLVGALLTVGPLSAKASLICALVAAAYGGLDELHQSFVPYRSATVIDLVKDWIGVTVSWWIVREAYFRGVRFAWIERMLKSFQRGVSGC